MEQTSATKLTQKVVEPNRAADASDADVKINLVLFVCFGVSIVLLLITASSFFIFERLQDPKRRFLIVNFCVSTMLAQAGFLVTQNLEHQTICLIGTALTSCFVLASFNWMLINVYVMRSSLSNPTEDYPSPDNLKIVIGWGIPMLLAFVAVIVNQTTDLDGYGEVSRSFDYVFVLLVFTQPMTSIICRYMRGIHKSYSWFPL